MNKVEDEIGEAGEEDEDTERLYFGGGGIRGRQRLESRWMSADSTKRAKRV